MLFLKPGFSPHIISFDADTGSKIQFRYEKYTDPDPETGKAVFVAIT